MAHELRVIVEEMRALGVLRYRLGDLEIVLGPAPVADDDIEETARKPVVENPFRHVLRRRPNAIDE